MNINDFENGINPAILARGRRYFEEGRVDSLKLIGTSKYKARVDGTDVYAVEVKLGQNGSVVDTNCDCPYTAGAFCKHLAAVLYAIRQAKLSQAISSPPSPAENRMIDDATLIKEARQTIQLSIRGATRSGFVDYWHVSKAVGGAKDVIEDITDWMESGRFVLAARLTLLVLNKMVDLIQKADDSDGNLGDIISECYDLLERQFSTGQLPITENRKIFEQILKDAANERFEGWTDMRLDLLDRAHWLVKTPEMRQKLESVLNSLEAEAMSSQRRDVYSLERINLIRYKLIAKFDSASEAQKYLDENIHFSEFRKMAIEAALQCEDYIRALNLVVKGLKQDQDLPGRVKTWRTYEYRIYCQTGQVEDQRRLATMLLIDGEIEYYHQIKETYAAEQWKSVYPTLLKQIRRSNIFLPILIEEQEFGLLLEYVQRNIGEIDHYYKYLIPACANEVFKVFEKDILNTAEAASNRREYQSVCRKVKLLIKASGSENARAICQHLIELYPRRPALADEISHIKFK